LPKEYYVVVDKKIIPRQFRESKYKALIERASKLTGDECLQVVEQDGISVTAIMSQMRKLGYKVTQRKIDSIVNLFIYKKT